MKKQALCILLVLAMLLAFCAGCSTQTPSTETPDTPATTTDNTDTPTEVEVPDQYKSVADVWSGITLSESPYGFNYDLNYNGRTDKTDLYLHGAGSWPICDWGEKEVSLWMPLSDNVLAITPDAKSYAATNFLWGMTQERTGVKVNFELVSSSSAQQKFPLVIASGEYPDIMNGISYYNGGTAKALEDEVISDLTAYVDEYMPNYMHWVNMTPANLKEGKTDSGQVVQIYSTTMTPQPSFWGPMIRKDWLDDAGLDIPVTLSDWHEMLCVFRDNYSNGEPLPLTNPGYEMGQCFSGAFDVYYMGSSNIYMQIDGKVTASVQQDGFREYLEMMAQWYSEGLIDSDYVSRGTDSSPITDNEQGVVFSVFTVAGDFYSKLGADPNCYFECIENPIYEEGRERKVYFRGYDHHAMASGGVVLSSQLSEEDMIVAMRMLDWQFTEEGTIAGQYGKEGVSFNFDENGHPWQTDLITNNPDGLSSSNAQDLYMCNNYYGGKLFERETDVCDDAKKHHLDVWDMRGEYTISGTLTYTPEEINERAALASDIGTYVDEFVAKIITGAETMSDEVWNEFQSILDGYQIDRVTEITQAAYDRYQNR